MAFKCKTCGAKLRVRSSSDITENTRQIYYECTAAECGESYNGLQSLGDVVRPSLLAIGKMALDSFLCSIPEDKREQVLKILNG